uniref:Uncharacterized protein n=1 Tax=Rhizophora mucronata TaxID=61149 RepID=A0A2P2NEX8_RHIMU
MRKDFLFWINNGNKFEVILSFFCPWIGSQLPVYLQTNSCQHMSKIDFIT